MTSQFKYLNNMNICAKGRCCLNNLSRRIVHGQKSDKDYIS
jgi:hypothetical protein